MVEQKANFFKGINKRFNENSIDTPDRLLFLKNARLQKRGDTGTISRIEGCEELVSNLYSDVLDMLHYYDSEDVLLVFYKSGTTAYIDRVTINTPTQSTIATFTIDATVNAENSKLIQLENNVYISPVNKQLNYVGGQWILNNFISTTPTLTADFVGGTKATGTITVNGTVTDTGVQPSSFISFNGYENLPSAYPAGSIEVTSMIGAGSGVFTVDVEGTRISETVSINGGVDTIQTTANKLISAINGSGGGADMYLYYFAEIDPSNDAKINITSLNVATSLVTLTVNLNTISGSSAFNSTIVDLSGGGASGVYRYKISNATEFSNDFTLDMLDTETSILNKIVTAFNSAGSDFETGWTATNETTHVEVKSDSFTDTINGDTFDLIFVSGDNAFSLTSTPLENGRNNGLPIVGLTVSLSGSDTINDITVNTSPINGGTSNTSVATTIKNSLESSAYFLQYFTVSQSSNELTITAINPGIEYNMELSISLLAGLTLVVDGVDNGASIGGTLKQETDYYYKARYVYFDGHKTITCYPRLIRTTTSSRKVELTIATVEDLDSVAGSKYADIEIFRKEDVGDWYLIDRVTPTTTSYTYVDSGSVEIALLDEQLYTWQTNYQTHEIVRDRYVRANVDYIDRKPNVVATVEETTIETIVKNQDILPPNSIIDIYVKERFDDGLETFHEKIGTVEVGDEQSSLTITQTSSSSNNKEIAYYANVKKTTDNEAVIPFNSLEIYNKNVPSILTTDDELQDKPTNPHIFFGFKYISCYLNYEFTSGSNVEFDRRIWNIMDSEWDTETGTLSFDKDNVEITVDSVTSVPTRYDFEWNEFTLIADVGDVDELFPETVVINPTVTGNGTTIGTPLTYRRKWVKPELMLIYDALPTTTITRPMAIYELAYIDALKEATRQNKLKLSLKGVNDGVNLSSTRPNSDYINAEFDVVGILDTSETQNLSFENNNLYQPSKNHIYLQLASGGIYDEFDIPSSNNFLVRADYDNSEYPDYTHKYSFVLNGVREGNFGTETFLIKTFTDTEVTYREYISFRGLKSATGLSSDVQGLIYLGVETDIDGGVATIPENLGVIFDIVNNFAFYNLKSSNIYETLLLETDLQTFTTDYPNQIVWSESYILGSNANGSRNFTFSNFLNLERTYGEIIYLGYILDKLLVFCNRGVAVVSVGEVVTQQVSGQVVVDSSTLLNGYFFALRNLPDIKAKSIVKYENNLFFGDGVDVWMYDGSFKNISNGSILLSKTADWVGAFDVANKEYIISDGTLTYAYSVELGEWMGEYYFNPKTFAAFSNRLFTVSGTKLVEHNIGNTNNGVEYETEVGGITNGQGMFKQFRKYYVELANETGATFEYGKTFSDLELKNIIDTQLINNYYNIGIKTNKSLATSHRWKLRSTQEGFKVIELFYVYNQRNRR